MKQNNIENLKDLLQKWRAPFSQLPPPYFPLEINEIRIQWNHRMRSRAGVCRPRQGLVELNPNILKSQNQIEEVLVHELCHMAVSQRWPRARPHGQRWKSLMTKFGFKPLRCHDLVPEKLHRQRRWPLKCLCGEHQVSTVIFNRIKKGARYRCRACRNVLHSTEMEVLRKPRGFFSRIFS